MSLQSATMRIPPLQPGWQLAMHLISEHADPMAIARTRLDNIDQHTHEHFGPCGIRNHPFSLLRYDNAKVELVLQEAEEIP